MQEGQINHPAQIFPHPVPEYPGESLPEGLLHTLLSDTLLSSGCRCIQKDLEPYCPHCSGGKLQVCLVSESRGSRAGRALLAGQTLPWHEPRVSSTWLLNGTAGKSRWE